MRYLKLVFLLILLSFTGYSCLKDKLVGEYYLSEEDKAAVPFHGYESSAFVHGIDDSIQLTAGPRENQLHKGYLDNEQTEYVIWEDDYIAFTNDIYILKYFLSTNSVKYLAIDLKYKVASDEVSYSAFYKLPLSKENLLDKNIYSDSLLMHNNWYYNIFIDSMIYSAQYPKPEINPYPTWCYYSSFNGMIKLDFSDGSSWELKENVW
jgi:hypothetical protein